MKENGKALHRHNISDRLWEKIKHYCREGRGNRVGRLMTINGLSTRYPGVSEPALSGEMYPLNTAAGKIHTDAFAADGIGVCGKA
jgi:hypothetical protein